MACVTGDPAWLLDARYFSFILLTVALFSQLTRVSLPKCFQTWALLCLLVGCALAATSENSSLPEVTTSAISSLAFDTVTVQAPVLDAKATEDQDDDDDEDDVGDDDDDDDEDDEDEDEESAAETKGSLKSNTTADAKVLKDGGDEKASKNATVRRHAEHEASTSKSVKITVSKVTGSGNETREALEAEVVVPAPVPEGSAAPATATTDKNKLAGKHPTPPSVQPRTSGWKKLALVMSLLSPQRTPCTPPAWR